MHHRGGLRGRDPIRTLPVGGIAWPDGISPVTKSWIAEINTVIAHLRDVLGEQTHESLVRNGRSMTTAMANYVYDQIDQVRTELEQLADSMGNTDRR